MPNPETFSPYHSQSSETLRDATNVNATGEGRNATVNEGHDDSAVLNPSGRIALDGASRKRKQNKSSTNPIKLGTWNIRTLKKLGQLQLLIKELHDF